MRAIPLLLACAVGHPPRGPGWSGTPLSVTVGAELIPGHCRALLSQCCSHSTCTMLWTEEQVRACICTQQSPACRTKMQVLHVLALSEWLRKSHPAEWSPPYLLHRSLATFHLLFLGDCWIPVTHQAIILDTVVLITKKPVGFHFPFALGQEEERAENSCFHGVQSRAENHYGQSYYLYHICYLFFSEVAALWGKNGNLCAVWVLTILFSSETGLAGHWQCCYGFKISLIGVFVTES